MNQTLQERNQKTHGIAAPSAPSPIISLLVLAIAFGVRAQGNLPPFDDAYHLKRFELFPLLFDPDRGLSGAFCPWPPLYDLFGAAVLRSFGSVEWLPPVVLAIFAAGVTLLFTSRLAALTAGLTIALSPYLIAVSRRWHIDHHYVEPLLVLLIIGATRRRRGVLLGVAIAAALLVQPALLAAAAVSFAAFFFWKDGLPHEGTKGFAIAAAVVALYRLAQPPGYPGNGWFLGYPHAMLLAGAAVACALRRWTSRPLALMAGVSVAATIPPLVPGAGWLDTIVEFAPMFRDPSRIGTDLANLTGGAILSLTLFRRHRELALFALVYLVLALSGRRFLVTAIPLFAIGGALVVAEARSRLVAFAAAAATLLPPLIYDIATAAEPLPAYAEVRALAAAIRKMPPGRVLAPWSFGHAINVLGRHPVVLDNFGPAPNPELFREAAFALNAPEKYLQQWCRRNGVRYVVRPGSTSPTELPWPSARRRATPAERSPADRWRSRPNRP